MHAALGPGYQHEVYRRALSIELRNRAVPIHTEVPLELRYRGEVVGRFEAEMVVNAAILVELKTTASLEQVDEQNIARHLKLARMHVGLIINFGPARMSYRRVVV